MDREGVPDCLTGVFPVPLKDRYYALGHGKELNQSLFEGNQILITGPDPWKDNFNIIWKIVKLLVLDLEKASWKEGDLSYTKLAE